MAIGFYRFAPSSPEGGIHNPTFVDASHLLYRSAEKNGQSALRLINLPIREQTRASRIVPFSKEQVNWVAPSIWEAHYGAPSRASIDTPDEAYPVRAQSTLFPAVLQTSRLPYADGSFLVLSCLEPTLLNGYPGQPLWDGIFACKA